MKKKCIFYYFWTLISDAGSWNLMEDLFSYMADTMAADGLVMEVARASLALVWT